MSVQKSSERLLCEKEYVWNLSTCACKIDKYQKSIIGDSVVICDEITEVKKHIRIKPILTKFIPTNSNENRKFLYVTLY